MMDRGWEMPPPEMNGGAGQGTPKSQGSNQQNDIAETAPDRQAPSALDLQIFCLARRFALNASLAEAVAVLVYGGLRT
jgi:hypothetical protein